MANNMNLNSRDMAILITKFDLGIEEINAQVKVIDDKIESLQGYQSEQTKRLLAKMEEVKANIKTVLRGFESEKAIVDAKRKLLIQREGENIFQGISIEEVSSTEEPVVGLAL